MSLLHLKGSAVKGYAGAKQPLCNADFFYIIQGNDHVYINWLMNEKLKCQPITNKPDGYIMTRGKQEHTEVEKQDQVLCDAF